MKWYIKLTILEIIAGVLFMLYELFTGQPWSLDGTPWTMNENFHLNLALGCFGGAGYTFIFGAVLGAIQERNHALKE